MPPKTDSAEKKFIKYTDNPGLVSERIISKKDLETVGIKVDNDVVFNRENRFMVDATNAGDDVLEFFSKEPGFTVSSSDSAPRTFDGVNLGMPAPTLPSGSEGSVGAPTAPTSGGSTAGASGT